MPYAFSPPSNIVPPLAQVEIDHLKYQAQQAGKESDRLTLQRDTLQTQLDVMDAKARAGSGSTKQAVVRGQEEGGAVAGVKRAVVRGQEEGEAVAVAGVKRAVVRGQEEGGAVAGAGVKQADVPPVSPWPLCPPPPNPKKSL